jgi:hypothetical protein
VKRKKKSVVSLKVLANDLILGKKKNKDGCQTKARSEYFPTKQRFILLLLKAD